MNYILIPFLFLFLLLTDWISARGHMTKREQTLYLFLSALALLSAVPAAYRMQIDHGGTALSSALSLFIS